MSSSIQWLKHLYNKQAYPKVHEYTYCGSASYTCILVHVSYHGVNYLNLLWELVCKSISFVNAVIHINSILFIRVDFGEEGGSGELGRHGHKIKSYYNCTPSSGIPAQIVSNENEFLRPEWSVIWQAARGEPFVLMWWSHWIPSPFFRSCRNYNSQRTLLNMSCHSIFSNIQTPTLGHNLHGDPSISLELNEKWCHLIHSFVKDTNRFK
jgi:hypothetical protein